MPIAHCPMPSPIYPRILPAGDAALTVEFGDVIESQIHDRVLAFASQVVALDIPGILEIVPTYRSATVYVDPMKVEIDELTAQLDGVTANAEGFDSSQGRTVEIPILYGEEVGPDLPDVAAFSGLSIEGVIALHSSMEYRCYMLGFSPGFPYLGRVPSAIAMPRLSNPRSQVSAGSVGIAGHQTGIYPQTSPGGWRIIGRTPQRIYDPARPQPFLIAAGDRVRFIPISRKEFADLLIC